MLRDFGSLNFCMHSTSGEVERVIPVDEFAMKNGSIALAVGGGFATGGTAWALWGAGAALDGYSVFQSWGNFSYGAGSLAIPPTGKYGTVWATGNAIYNGYGR